MCAESARGLSVSYAAKNFIELVVEHRRTNRYRRLFKQILHNIEKMHPKASVVDSIERSTRANFHVADSQSHGYL